MKPLTWREIIIGEQGLKEYREKNNIYVPAEYILSTKRIAMYACFLSFTNGAAIVLLLNILGVI